MARSFRPPWQPSGRDRRSGRRLVGPLRPPRGVVLTTRVSLRRHSSMIRFTWHRTCRHADIAGLNWEVGWRARSTLRSLGIFVPRAGLSRRSRRGLTAPSRPSSNYSRISSRPSALEPRSENYFEGAIKTVRSLRSSVWPWYRWPTSDESSINNFSPVCFRGPAAATARASTSCDGSDGPSDIPAPPS